MSASGKRFAETKEAAEKGDAIALKNIQKRKLTPIQVFRRLI